MTRWNMLYPLARKKPNARYIGEVYQAAVDARRSGRRWSRRTSGSPTRATR